ncbi:hypothetical protein [Lacticaseibacillus saniviri]|uniref:Uncharacterized protein n=1 Tax=Lacticaseibacillus saniviri JCM 17471 = DSM 24301 TaxID=1293598 RepID=A0A0R2MYI4_9LACO|nr:hypothetical protein [Lacticaseibacillus saniviri]KRO18581.1 hypothetical protein IV56_GL000858 [Lacticaseibacillus saniviri JCM 17471 = DSM 24301]MCG4282376.1 hypothetical protein [Lacticaseibacillus saniviri]
MENKVSRFSSISRSIQQSYQEFFDLNEPIVAMPASQRDLFLDQAMTKHYRVALFLDGQDQPVMGYLNHHLSGQRLLLNHYRTNVASIITPTQVLSVKRV